MDQQSKHKKADVLDLSAGDSTVNSSRDQGIEVSEYKLRTEMKKKQNMVRNASEEELRIRGELESDIERNLEEEIKDGIYHLALRLHRLYQHKKERKLAGEGIDSGDNKNNKTLSEVNISIRMEGGTKIEIKEMKKEAPEYKSQLQVRPWSSRSENVQAMPVANNKKFDWARSLRSRADPKADINMKNRRYNQGMSQNLHIDMRKGSAIGVDNQNKLLQLRWKW